MSDPLRPYGPNVDQIQARAYRIVRGRIPAQVRRELMAAVKAGDLGHLKKDGLKPEIFFHPDHRNGALDAQKREAAYSVSCIAKVLPSPGQVRGGIAAMEGKARFEDTAAFAAMMSGEAA